MKKQSQDNGNDSGKVLAPWERAFDRVITPFEEFIHNQTSSGIILMTTTLVALALANSPWAQAYTHFIHTSIAFSVGGWTLEKTLQHWVNDGLMALFFFLVGLEIKREILVGELASMRQAALPLAAALGGMVVPALIYFALNSGGAVRGWGIPMATDIAFAVGVLVLLGTRVPRSLMMFLVALAIVDDLGAVLVIALFYTETINYNALGAAAGLLGGLVVLSQFGVRKPLPYFLIGGLLWLAMLSSGIHATVAGILVALTIPARPIYEPIRFSSRTRELLKRFESHHRPGMGILRNQEQHSIVQTLENAVHSVQTPLQRLEHAFHLPVGVVIIPIFALVNAGIPIDVTALDSMMLNPVTLGVMAGLLLGKVTGIAGVSWLAVRLGVARFPTGVNLSHIIGVGILGGIGFTMSIFIAELGFSGMARQLLAAKTGILFASLIAGIAGYCWLRWVLPAGSVTGGRH